MSRLAYIVLLGCVVTGCGDDNTGVPGGDGGATDGAVGGGDGAGGGGGTCTGAGVMECAGACVDTRDNAADCGACGNACEGATPFCQGTTCVATCEAPRTDCNGACVDLMTDARHCGDCATDCGSAGTCSAGTCGACAAPGTLCGDQCADLASDPDHCGGCGMQCDAFTEGCSASGCVCRGALVDCDQAVDATDCRDTQNDAQHCGQCDRQCGDAEVCQTGECVCIPPLVRDAGGACADPASTQAACGTPPVDCGTMLCQGGACVAACGDGLNECSGGCVDVQTNPLHCGDCGERCGEGELCVAGECRGSDPATGCSTCPCAICEDKPCCAHPVNGAPICLDADACP
jgi:hypothetical protein